MDYAINSSLIIANTSLRKQDKAGLITFSDQVESIIRAERSKNQLRLILDTLYREQESALEANYEGLYLVLKKQIPGRSLIFSTPTLRANMPSSGCSLSSARSTASTCW
ncbi:MAG: hypothetical protein HC880_21650 [Bacteroidia bacterium]|nr:hypothetical protein [Bacteroidia bacterium]